MDEMKNLEDRLCGRDIPDPIIAVHQRVELVFKSDYAGAGHRGFFGHYKFIGESESILAFFLNSVSSDS